jgi:hypothetical protein
MCISFMGCIQPLYLRETEYIYQSVLARVIQADQGYFKDELFLPSPNEWVD